MIYNKTNFHKNTFCIFNEVDIENFRSKKADFSSKSGSQYFFVETGVIRISNHWGRAANCKWRLQDSENKSSSRIKAGFAKWTDFQRDNDSESLYFIKSEFEKRTVSFFHKETQGRDLNAILRTASETTKRIKQIRVLISNPKWTNHYPLHSPDQLLKWVVTKMISTNLSLQQIKSTIEIKI